MKLYGTTTSPFVRRVRVIASEIGEPVELIDTAPDAGQAQLREVSPIRKVPVAVFGERTIYDSRVIGEWLVTTRGWGALVPPRDSWEEQNLVIALEEALFSTMQVFYLRRDGVAVEGSAFEKRQLDRVDAIFAWANPQLREDALGIPEITAVCALDWMDFRAPTQVWQTERAGLASFRAAWRSRPSLASSMPKV